MGDPVRARLRNRANRRLVDFDFLFFRYCLHFNEATSTPDSRDGIGPSKCKQPVERDELSMLSKRSGSDRSSLLSLFFFCSAPVRNDRTERWIGSMPTPQSSSSRNERQARGNPFPVVVSRSRCKIVQGGRWAVAIWPKQSSSCLWSLVGMSLGPRDFIGVQKTLLTAGIGGPGKAALPPAGTRRGR